MYSTKQTHLFCCEDQRSQDHMKTVQDELEGCNFVIREFPMQRLFNEGRRHNANASGDSADFSAGMNVKEHDMPELVVFIQEDHQQFVKDICIDKVVSPEGKCESEDYELDHEIICEGEVEELDSTENHKISIVQPMKKTASETLREAFRKETDFSRSFKNWQINSFLAAIGSRAEFPQVTETSMSRTEMSNTGSGKRQVDYTQETSSIALGSLSAPATISHKSNDSLSSTHSFAFPILPVEWNGSPVRMSEADKSQSRKQWWEKILFPCCK